MEGTYRFTPNVSDRKHTDSCFQLLWDQHQTGALCRRRSSRRWWGCQRGAYPGSGFVMVSPFRFELKYFVTQKGFLSMLLLKASISIIWQLCLKAIRGVGSLLLWVESAWECLTGEEGRGRGGRRGVHQRSGHNDTYIILYRVFSKKKPCKELKWSLNI